MELNETKVYVLNKEELRRIIFEHLKERGIDLNEATTSFNWGAEQVKITALKTSKNLQI